jgi:cobalt-precorrin-5B (C1)-methyltransferase
MAKRLRSGFTTGSCSAAAAKAAAEALLNGSCRTSVEIPFPDGSRKSFAVHTCLVSEGVDSIFATASIIKDAGDDPDVTNKAEISATVSLSHSEPRASDCVLVGNIQLWRGEGVGTVTKPGLAIGVGEPAINPVPRQMIAEAVGEITSEPVKVIISVTGGERLAEKTLNKRLGILGGLSILGTTGIVRPISADAWTATIAASMDVAKSAGLDDIVISTGRTSERGAQQLLNLPEEAYAMMGDYLEFSLKQAAKTGFSKIHLSGMWAKVMKAALRIPQTHVRNGALEVADGANLLEHLGASGELLKKFEQANTAREMLTHIEAAGATDLIQGVLLKAKQYAEDVSGVEVAVYLIDHKAEVIARV